MKIRLVVAELLHADGQMSKLIVAFSNFANSPKISIPRRSKAKQEKKGAIINHNVGIQPQESKPINNNYFLINVLSLGG